MTVKKGEALFPRIDVEKEIEELNAIIKNNEKVDEKQQSLKKKLRALLKSVLTISARLTSELPKLRLASRLKRLKSF